MLNNNRLQKHYVPVILTFRAKKSEGASVFRMASLSSYTRKRRLVTVTKFSFKYQLCLHPWVIHINFSGQKVVFHYLSLFTQNISCRQSKLGFLLLWPFIHSNSLVGQQKRYTMIKRTERERDLSNSTGQASSRSEAACQTVCFGTGACSGIGAAKESPPRFLPHTTNISVFICLFRR